MRQSGLAHAAGRMRSKKNKKKTRKTAAVAKTHHEIHSSPATTINSRRHATKHVPRICPYSPASIDAGFVEIGFGQLSKSVSYTHLTLPTKA